MGTLDLFENLVRFYSVKPLPFEHFDLEKAKTMIKKDKVDEIIFIDDHIHFEDLIEEITKKIIETDLDMGTVYIHIHGKGCSERLKRNLMNLLMSVNKIFILGTEKEWLITDPKIHYNDPESIFVDNHQRFFIYQSSSYNIALISRKNLQNGKHEAVMTNNPQAVSIVAQAVGLKLYQS